MRLSLLDQSPRSEQTVGGEFETRLRRNRDAVIAGDHAEVAAQVIALCARTGTDEVMASFPEPDPAVAADQLRGFTQAVNESENRRALTRL